MDVVLFQKFSKTNNGNFVDYHLRREQVPNHASREAKQADFQAPHKLPKRHLPRQLSKHRVDLHSPDHCLRVTGTIPTTRRRDGAC